MRMRYYHIIQLIRQAHLFFQAIQVYESTDIINHRQAHQSSTNPSSAIINHRPAHRRPSSTTHQRPHKRMCDNPSINAVDILYIYRYILRRLMLGGAQIHN